MGIKKKYPSEDDWTGIRMRVDDKDEVNTYFDKRSIKFSKMNIYSAAAFVTFVDSDFASVSIVKITFSLAFRSVPLIYSDST